MKFRDPSPNWLDGNITFYMRSRRILLRRRGLGWLITYQPAGDVDGLGPELPTWNATSTLVSPDRTPYPRRRSASRQIGWIGLRPCIKNGFHSATLDTSELHGPENNVPYLHAFTPESIAVGILTAAGRALGHTVLCAPPDTRVTYSGRTIETLQKLGYTPNTIGAIGDQGGIRDMLDIWRYGENELHLNEHPPTGAILYFPAIELYSGADEYDMSIQVDGE